MMLEKDEKRFSEKVTESSNWDVNQCWVWNAARDSDGYGKFQFEKKSWRAHRWIYNFYVKEISDDILVLHKCNNPPCVNPNHLYDGTIIDNNRYRTESDNCSFATLNVQNVLTILQGIEVNNYFSIEQIAKSFGVKRNTITGILDGSSWRMVTKKYYTDNELYVLFCKVKQFLQEDSVRDIRLRLKNNESMQSIANLYNVDYQKINNIKNNRTFKDVI
jgi:hypothetical protein